MHIQFNYLYIAHCILFSQQGIFKFIFTSPFVPYNICLAYQLSNKDTVTGGINDESLNAH